MNLVGLQVIQQLGSLASLTCTIRCFILRCNFRETQARTPPTASLFWGGSIRTLLGWVHASDCEKRGIIVDLLSNFTHGVQAIPRFGNALGVGQASLASASSPFTDKTIQELREAADPDGGREAVWN